MVRTNKGPRYPPPPLFPAVKADIPAILAIWLAARAPDLLVQTVSRPDEQARLTLFLNERFSNPLASIIKAVDWKDPNRITAVGIWEKKNYSSPSPSGCLEASVSGTENGGGKCCVGFLISGNGNTKEGEKGTPIEDFIRDRQLAFNDTWPNGVKHMELVLLMTDPAFQHRGIGTALLKWGHALADAEQVPCFLCASPFGWPLYRALGWHQVGEELVIELKEFVKYAEGGDQGWGVYKMRFMLRLPRVTG
jgi:GNAT superfamily N-acetyltransferase